MSNKQKDSKWQKLKNEFYGTKTCVQSEYGTIDFDPDSMGDVVGGDKLTYDEYLDILMRSGQMKILLDRLNPLYPTDYKFREIYMIATAAEDEESTFEKAYNGLQGWVDCFEKAELKGIVTGGGIDAANTAADHSGVMKKAYELKNMLSVEFPLWLSRNESDSQL